MKQTKISKKRNAAFISHREQIYGLEMYFKKKSFKCFEILCIKKTTTESLKLDRPPPFSVCNYQSP